MMRTCTKPPAKGTAKRILRMNQSKLTGNLASAPRNFADTEAYAIFATTKS